MKLFKYLTIIFLSCFIVSCGTNSGKNKSDFAIITNAKDNTISNAETLKLSIENLKNYKIDSVNYTLNGKSIKENTDLKSVKLGIHNIEATLYYNNKQQKVSSKITVLNNEPPKIYTYNIINEYPHDIASYTQGLEFYNDTLYESTGQQGKSKLRKVDYKTGEILKNINLANQYFGEGLSVLNDKVYQLTWQGGIGFVYNATTLEKLKDFKYGKSKEGWGLCNDGNTLYKSDGTENIWLLNTNTLAEEDHIQVYTNKGKIVEINELEWINGEIYANRWQKDGVAIINPENGAVIGVIDFSPLKKRVTQHEALDVLNGIAYNPKTKTIFVTGKYWDKLFEVEIVEN